MQNLNPLENAIVISIDGFFPSKARLPLELLLLTLLLGVIIAMTMWPWPMYFFHGLPKHFDPPFHAWKLQIIADKLLRNHQFFPDTATNIYYPYANEFYFDALLWPQGITAALFQLVGCGPVLTYNLVFLLFWTLSGTCTYLLLRELDLGRTASLFGALAFCIIPYRISYYVEFNMQLCFGVPLFLFLWARYAKNPTMPGAICLGLAFWLQAVSELYQAVILVISFPFLALPFIRSLGAGQVQLGRFLRSVLAGLFTVIPLSLAFLLPYFSLFREGYNRNVLEMTTHSLEPLTYGGNILARIFHNSLPGQETFHSGEMIVFPSFTLIILVCGYFLTRKNRFKSESGQEKEVVLPWARRTLFLSLLTFFLVICLLEAGYLGDHATAILFYLGNGSLVPAFVASVLLAWFTSRNNSSITFHAGLGAAALLSFCLSLGPNISVLNQKTMAPNLLFDLVNTVFPLHGLRVMSRFSIMVMMFLVITASLFLEGQVEKKKGLRWLSLLAAVSLIFEAVIIPRRYWKFDMTLRPAVSAAISGASDRSIAVLPLGIRDFDARYMLGIAGTNTLMVNGWGGFVPELQVKISRALADKPTWALNLIASIWPRPLIVIDRLALMLLNNEGYATREDDIRNRAKLLAEGGNYAVYQLPDLEIPGTEHQTFIRGDLLRARPLFSFEARTSAEYRGPQQLLILVNGTVIDSVIIDGAWRRYEISVPQERIAEINYEIISLRGENPGAWNVRHVDFLPSVPPSTSLTP